LLGSSKDSEDERNENPFAFTKSQLGRRLYEPKNLNLLRAMEGLGGLVMGLRTDLHKGLSPDEDDLDGYVTVKDVWRTFENQQSFAIQRGLFETNGVGDETVLLTDTPAEQLTRERLIRQRKPKKQNEMGFGDRRRAFGENKIPVLPSKNIFQLMWLTLHDKTLV
jgi:hypothetical protein